MDKDDNRAQPASAGPDAPRCGHAGALAQAWVRLSRQLVPLIGEAGFGALFGRTLRLVAPGHAWLSVDPARRSSSALLAGLEADLAGVGEAEAAAANEELTSTFTRQLAALIGPGLTERLLAEHAAGDRQQQNQQEHKQ